MTHERIFLIGMMGAGKSYWGQRLAAHLQWDFIDLDAYLSEKEGRSIARIFEEDEERGFRLLEQKYLHEVLSATKTVIATGGGTPCFFDNMDRIKQSGLSVYLKTSAETLAERLAPERSTRPLLNTSAEALLDRLRSLLEERKPFYEMAALVLNQEDPGFESALMALDGI